MLTIPVLFVIYLGFGGWMYSQLYDLTFMRGVYFTWVTISTIGFGDYTVHGCELWESITNIFIILFGLFLFSYAVAVVGNVTEKYTKPACLREIFNDDRLTKIELVSMMHLTLSFDSFEEEV